MTHLETHWVNETLDLKIAEVRTIATQLSSDDLQQLDSTIMSLLSATHQLKEIVDSYPHKKG